MRWILAASSTLLLSAFPALGQDDVAKGEKLFVNHCARCHGVGAAGGEGPSLRRPTLRHAVDSDALLQVIQNGIEGTDMPGTWIFSESEARQVASYVRSVGRVEKATLSGDSARGREIFDGKGGCSTCHVVAGDGGTLGPDLTEVGLRRGAAYLRESLVAPGESVADGYLPVEAVSLAGDRVTGVRVNEDSFTIQIRDVSGAFHSLSKRDLRTLEKKMGESLMPAYGIELGGGEIEDLVAYLASLRGEQ